MPLSENFESKLSQYSGRGIGEGRSGFSNLSQELWYARHFHQAHLILSKKKKKKNCMTFVFRLTNGKTEACTGQVAARWHSRSLWPKAQDGSTTWPAALLGQGRRQSQRLLCDPLTFTDGLFLPFNSILHPQWARFCGLSIENEWTSSKTTNGKRNGSGSWHPSLGDIS